MIKMIRKHSIIVVVKFNADTLWNTRKWLCVESQILTREFVYSYPKFSINYHYCESKLVVLFQQKKQHNLSFNTPVYLHSYPHEIGFYSGNCSQWLFLYKSLRSGKVRMYNTPELKEKTREKGMPPHISVCIYRAALVTSKDHCSIDK